MEKNYLSLEAKCFSNFVWFFCSDSKILLTAQHSVPKVVLAKFWRIFSQMLAVFLTF